MLTYEVIKYNIGEYSDFASLDKLGDDIFLYYVKKNLIGAADYLCSIRDEQRLIEVLEKNNITPITYIEHCWMTSGVNVGFMMELFGWLPITVDIPLNIFIDFLNLDIVCRLDDLKIRSLLGMLPTDTNYNFYPEHALKLLPFIEKQVRHGHNKVNRLYLSLDSSNKLRIINDLRDNNIDYMNLIGLLNPEEITIFIEKSETFSKDVALECISTILESEDANYCEVLLEPTKYPCYKYIKMIRKKTSEEQELSYLPKPDPIEIKYNIFLSDTTFDWKM